jgi:hypothetical protein
MVVFVCDLNGVIICALAAKLLALTVLAAGLFTRTFKGGA